MSSDTFAVAPDEPDAAEPEPVADVCALQTCPERTLFTERDNADGWISTDLTVDPER